MKSDNPTLFSACLKVINHFPCTFSVMSEDKNQHLHCTLGLDPACPLGSSKASLVPHLFAFASHGPLSTSSGEPGSCHLRCEGAASMHIVLSASGRGPPLFHPPTRSLPTYSPPSELKPGLLRGSVPTPPLLHSFLQSLYHKLNCSVNVLFKLELCDFKIA